MGKDNKVNIYQNVPGRGDYLPDGTWWTESDVEVEHQCDGTRGRTICIEVAFFDGRRFTRWRFQ